MKERPILFSAPMVRAILEGRKTQTRRVVKAPRGHELVELRSYEADPRFSGMHNDPMSWGYPYFDDGAPALLGQWPELCPYGVPGDRLWVREAHAIVPRTAYRCSDGVQQVLRPDDDHDAAIFREGWERSTGGIRWRPSIHMPRWASRIDLEVTGVRVERLQEMEGQGPYPGESDALAEGVHRIHHGDGEYYYSAFRNEPHPNNWCDPTDAFRELWESINGAGSWDANPWVWVVEFKRIKP